MKLYPSNVNIVKDYSAPNIDYQKTTNASNTEKLKSQFRKRLSNSKLLTH
jgi:hypothetical protein